MRKFEYVSKYSEGYGLPKRSTKNSAGYDFICQEEVTIQPHERKLVSTRVKAEFPETEVLLLFNRSSNPTKKGLVLLNGVGVIDSDYYNNPNNEGEIGFLFMNISDEPVTLVPGDKLGQGIFTEFKLVEDDECTDSRVGGFGSTGN